MRYLLLVIAALMLSGCAGMDIAGGQITTAQAQYLAAQDARAARDAEADSRLVAAIERLADSADPMVRLVGITTLDRIAAGKAAPRGAQMPAQSQDGPITTALKVVAPFVLPALQIWPADRAGERGMKQAFGNMDLIQTLAGQIQRDPLVVTTPAAQVIQVDPVIVTTPDPVIVDREVPVIVDQPVVVTVPGS